MQLFTMSILPEEDITGFVVRQSYERSQGRVLVKPNTLAESTKRPGWAFPSGLGRLMEEFRVALPNIEDVIDNHTRFPLYAPFLSPSDSKVLREHHEGRAMKGIAAHVGMVSGASRSRMAMCPECMDFDVKENGYAIWRRLSLMSGILACPVHKRPLLTFCGACEAGHRRMRTNWRPTVRCACGGSLAVVARLDEKAQEMAIGVAGMADQILRRTASVNVSSAAITKALAHHFGTCGALGPRSHERLKEALHQSIGPNGVSLLGIGTSTLKRLVGSSNSSGAIRNPIQNLAAIHAVFGGFDAFSATLLACQEKARYTNVDVEVANSNFDKRRKSRRLKGDKYTAWVAGLQPAQRTNLKTESRKWLLERMQEHPAIQRSDLWRLPGSYSALRYLMNIDTTWYDNMLPPIDGGRNRVAKELLLIQGIARLSAHIQQRYELSIREKPIRRVTKTYLLTNAPCESGSNIVLKSEEIQMALDAYAETPGKRRKRITDMVCEEVRRIFPNHPFGAEKTYINLDERSFARRFYRAKKWLTQNGN
jgi:hypothetical protein